MEKAKQAINSIERMAGHHDTTVHERVAPGVTKETVLPERREEVQTAIDKEVHQDHYHRTIQPVHEKQVLPEQHQHRVAAVEKREFDNRTNDNTKAEFEAERGQIRDERHVAETKQTQARAAAIQGEHVHHHVYEEVQPVLHKEVVQPEVVHTTVPIHEVHHEGAKNHGVTTLPAVSRSEFERQGGVLEGGRERRDHFEGCAKGLHSDGCGHQTGEGFSTQRSATGASGTTGVGRTADTTTGYRTGDTTTGHRTGDTTTGHRTGDTTTGHRTGAGVGAAGAGVGAAGAAGAADSRLPGTSHSAGGSTARRTSNDSSDSELGGQPRKKSSLLDRINPMKDSDGDGKKGFMS